MVYFEWTCDCKLKSTNQNFTLEKQSLIEKEMITQNILKENQCMVY